MNSHNSLPFPNFLRSTSNPDIDAYFNGPLYRVLLKDYTSAPGEPLPRLLLTFIRDLVKACGVWRDSCAVFWANNRTLVVKIATNYRLNSSQKSYYRLYSRRGDIKRIILKCNCCTPGGPCRLCEYNTQSLARLFRAELLPIRTYQTLQKLRNPLTPELETHIVEYLFGAPEHSLDPRGRFDHLDFLSELTLQLILFIQDTEFAPEIESIVTRQQLNTWIEGVETQRLRPHDQQAQHHSSPFYLDSLLRLAPHLRDYSWSGPNIPEYQRTPQFLNVVDYNPPDLGPIVRADRLLHNDIWRVSQASSTSQYDELAPPPSDGFVESELN
jgi:hypothetical protein